MAGDLDEAFAEFRRKRGIEPQMGAPTPPAPGFFASLFGGEEVKPAPVAEHPLAGAYDAYRAARGQALDGAVAGDVFKDWAGGTFQRSLDGDTIDLSTGKRRTPTRLAGIDAPESSQGAWGPAAQAYLDELVGEAPDGKIRVGSRTRDKRGRDVVMAYAGDKNLSVEMVRGGHARVYEDYLGGLSKEVRQQLVEAQAEAQGARRGMWEQEGGVDPAAFRQSGAFDARAGHDQREPLDPTTTTMAQAHREFLAARGMVPAEGGGAGAGGAQGYRPGELYQAPEGFLDRALAGLDYLGNVSRSAQLGGVRAIERAVREGRDKGEGIVEAVKGLWKAGGQAATLDRHTSATQLKDEATRALGLGKLRAGADDGRFQAGDLVDFGADLAIDIVTDPLTWVTEGVGAVAKGGTVLAKLLPAVHLGAVESRIGMATAEAARYQALKRGAAAGIGASVGMGASDPDASMGEKLVAAAGGAAAGYFHEPALAAVGRGAKASFDSVSDWYAAWTRGESFKDFSEARKLALGAYEKVRDVAEWIRQGRYRALEELKLADGTPDYAARIRASDVMKDLKTEFVERRNRAIAQLDFGDLKGDELAHRKRTFGKLEEDRVLANKIDRVTTEAIEKEYLPAVLKKEEQRIADAVVAWGKHNEAVVKKLNRDAFGLGDGLPHSDTGRGIFGVKWHIDDVYDKKNFEEAQAALGRFQIHAARSGERSLAADKLAMLEYQKKTGKVAIQSAGEQKLYDSIHSDALDKTYAVYTENFGKKFLDDAQRSASGMMFEYSRVAAKQPIMKGLETVLGGYDKLTNFIKANMLYFSSTWIKNNYFDNLAKSWVENGLVGVVDSASFGLTRKGVTADVKALYDNKLNRAYKAADLQDALARGVLDNPMFKSLDDKALRGFLYSPDQLKEAMAKGSSTLQRVGDFLVNKNPWVRFVASTGSHMEGTARMMTYIRIKEAVEKSPVFKGATPEQLAVAKDMAASVVKKTFFDYGDVTAFEKAVFSRLVPFYSFYSKNLPYWIKAAADPARVGRVAAIEKVRHGIGKDPSYSDKQGMPQYLAESAPRRLGYDGKGNKIYGIVPGTSLHDAIKMLDVRPGGLAASAIDKGSPILKGAAEAISGHDFFAGGSFLPSQIAKDEAAQRGVTAQEWKEGKKFLYSRGFKHFAIKKLAEKMGMDEGGLAQLVLGVRGVKVDERGNPFTTADSDVYIDKLWSTLWPKGALDQAAGSIGKVAAGKETLVEAIVNRALPMQNVKVSPAMERMIRNRKQGGAQ